MDRRIVSRGRLHITPALLFFIGATCSSGSSGTKDFPKAVKAVQSAIQPATADWAKGVATEADRQIHDLGAIDLDRLATGASTTAQPVEDLACAAIKKNKALIESGDQSLDARAQLADFVKRETTVPFARFPLVFYDLKTTWPAAWLKDQGHQADFTAPAPKADPQYLKTLLAPRFVADDGSFIVPAPESPDAIDFSDWMKQGDNHFGGAISLITKPITAGIFHCVSVEVSKK